ncbi:MAG: TlpA family protein disulfide reductase [Rickettsiaceae bacterium]|nr:MAG: TlpA family protein disulfide reductase [Rickettsiaceae bacterium]
MKEKWLSVSQLLNLLLLAIFLIVLFNPSAKALLMQGMMKIGLFQPALPVVHLKNNSEEKVADIVFQSFEGKVIHLNELQGKVVFINFWATWCPPCIAEMPTISALYQQLQDSKNMVFITVDVDHDFKKSHSFLIGHDLNLPLYEAAGIIPEAILDGSIPTTLVIDKKGSVVFRHKGIADYSNPKVLSYLTQLTLAK